MQRVSVRAALRHPFVRKVVKCCLLVVDYGPC
jgi:hypothetical protein